MSDSNRQSSVITVNVCLSVFILMFLSGIASSKPARSVAGHPDEHFDNETLKNTIVLEKDGVFVNRPDLDFATDTLKMAYFHEKYAPLINMQRSNQRH